jgi:hypothetical protein
VDGLPSPSSHVPWLSGILGCWFVRVDLGVEPLDEPQRRAAEVSADAVLDRANLVSWQEVALAGLAAAAGALPKAELRFIGEFAVGDRVLTRCSPDLLCGV